MEAPSSVPIVKAFGTRGIVTLGIILFIVLLAGSFSVWYYTGISTSELVLCLVQLDHQESSAQIGTKLVELTSQAATLLSLVNSSSTLLRSSSSSSSGSGSGGSSGGSGGGSTTTNSAPTNATQQLLERIAATASAPPGVPVAPFTAYLASIVREQPSFKLHLTTDEGAYVGLRSVANGTAAHLLRRAVNGCVEEVTVSYGWLGSSFASPSLPPGPPSSPPPASASCEWEPLHEQWYAANASCQGRGGGACWSAPYAVAGGAAVALQLRLEGRGGQAGGLVAVEVALSALEQYMQALMASSAVSSMMDVLLLDSSGALLATTQRRERVEYVYARHLPADSAWQDIDLALQRQARGEANPKCFLSFESKSADDRNSCGGFDVGKPMCSKVGPLPAGGTCVLGSDCQVAAVVNVSTLELGTPLPEGWRIRLKLGKEHYYPGFDAATNLTLALSISCSIMVSVLLTCLVWRYNLENGEPDLRICKLRIRPRIAQSLLVLVAFLNYSAVFGTWYSLFKSASHDWRDAIIQLLNEAMVDRVCTILELLPRTAQTMRTWSPIWNTSSALEPLAGEAASAIVSAPLSIFALELLRAVAPSSADSFVSAGPPADRVITDAPLFSVLYVPESYTEPVRGVQLLVQSGGGSVTHELLDECSGDDGCDSDPRQTAWWGAVAPVSGRGLSRWSEVHLLGDQLAVTFVLPVAGGDAPEGWVTCSLPLAALQSAFQRVGTGSVQLAGAVMESLTSHTSRHRGTLIASSANDAEPRLDVGGEWFTSRRLTSDSVEPRLRATVEAMARTLFSPSYVPPADSLIRTAPGSLWPTTRRVSPEESRIYRTFGASKTHITTLRGSGCDDGSAAPNDDCGLDWTAVVLIDWIGFFSDWYRDRDLSLLVFFIFLVLQLHVVQVLVHASFRHIEHEAAQAEEHDGDTRRPNHEEAIEELAQPDSNRSSKSTTRDSVGNARFERYRLHISEEVAKALSVRWQRFRALRFLQMALYKLIGVLPCGMQELSEIKRIKLQLSRPLALGLNWKDIGYSRPREGTEIIHAPLSAALQHQRDFTQAEFDEFALPFCVHVMHFDDNSFVKAGDKYFQPAPSETAKEKRHRQAIQFIRLAKQHRNLLTVCTLRSGSRFVALQLYLFQSTEAYRVLVQFIILWHCLLQAYEPTPGQLKLGRDAEPAQCPVSGGDSIMLLNLLCLLIEAADVICSRFVVRAERLATWTERMRRNGAVQAPRRRKDEEQAQGGGETSMVTSLDPIDSFGKKKATPAVSRASARRRHTFSFSRSLFEGENLLQPRSEAFRRMARSCLLVVIVADWLLLVSQCRALSVLPLRPIFFIVSSYSLSSTMYSIILTMLTKSMRSVIVCFFTLWLIMSMFASTMLRSQGNGIETVTTDCPAPPPGMVAPPPPPEAHIGHNGLSSLNAFSYTPVDFQSIIPSMLSTFILISTGENYAEVVSRPLFCFDLLNEGTRNVPTRAVITITFFIILSLIGLVLMVGMFIGVFQDGFARQRKEEIRKTKLFERVGAIAAFSLLDVDNRAQVPLSEFKEFVHSLERNLEMNSVLSAEELFNLLHDEEGNGQDGDGVLELTDFVYNLYYLQLTGVTFQRKEEDMNLSAWRQKLRDVYDHPSQIVQKVVKFTLIVHTLLACLYGLLATKDIPVLDHVLAVLLLLEALEVGFKMWAYGLRRFWSCGQYDASKIFEQWENRTAFVISATTLLVWLFMRPTSVAYGMGFKIEKDFHRVCLVTPTLRLFFVLKTARRIIFVLVPLRQYLISVLVLMLVYNFMFAIVGVTLFEGVLEDISNALDPEVVRITSFDSIGSAMLTLTQVLVGEGWHAIMFAVMNGRHSWYWAAFFMIFIIVQTLLLTNLLVGVILDSTYNFEEELSLQRHVLHGEELQQLEELKQGYAQQYRQRTDGDLEREAGIIARLSRCSEVTLRRSSAAAAVQRSSEVELRTSQVAPAGASQEPAAKGPAQRSNFQLLPQLTTRRLGSLSDRRKDTGRKSNLPHAAAADGASGGPAWWEKLGPQERKLHRKGTPDKGSGILPSTEMMTTKLI